MVKQATTEEFIAKSKIIHGDLYDYSESHYTGSGKLITVGCRTHGQFSVLPWSHLQGVHCAQCSRVKTTQALTNYNVANKMNYEMFIATSKELYGDKYDYSKVEYIDYQSKVKIICPIHNEINQTPLNHIRLKFGCHLCGRNSSATNRLGKSRSAAGNLNNYIDIIQEVVKIEKKHSGKYTYVLPEKYTGIRQKIKVICKEHGEIEQAIGVIRKGHICRLCSEAKYRMSHEEYITRITAINGKRYDYSQAKYINARTNITVICPKHGAFQTNPSNHLTANTGCFRCKESKGEIAIANYLDTLDIKYIREYTLPGAKNKYRYDFYLPEHDVLFEFHGGQHYKAVDHFGGKKRLKDTQKRDKVKQYLAKEAKLPLVTFNYKHLRYPEKQFQNLIFKAICLNSKSKKFHIELQSKGETFLSKVFDDANITYIREYRIGDNRYRYDFYLPDYKLLIEYHGGQHYHPVDYFGGIDGYTLTVERDKTKKALAKFSNLHLIYFKYTLMRCPPVHFKKLVLDILEAIKCRKSISWFFKEYSA